MKREIYIVASSSFLLMVLLAFFQTNHQEPSHPVVSAGAFVPFDQSMQLAQFRHITKREDFSYVYNFLKKIYNQHNFQTLQPSLKTRIPKIIHVMWLGGKMPQEFEGYVQSWRTYHPDWTILFWTDNQLNYDKGQLVVRSFNELEKLLDKDATAKNIVVDVADIGFDNRGFYDKAVNYGEKSDILKWEIVYRFGGVYVDTDFECLQAMDVYHHTYDFYTGIQPLDTNMVQLGAALYGAIPHHPILKACVENIKFNQHINQIVVKTGPIHFTKTFLTVAGRTGLRDVALPASYFYACGYEQRGAPKQEWCKAESYAVHHWAGSWLKPEAFVHA